MPNDAKLGLLAGVIGVIVVAVVSANRPPLASIPNAAANPTGSPTSTAAPTTEKPAGDSKPASTVARSTEPSSTPVIRTKPEPNGTPASRTPMDDIDQ